jgi:hypothetical protein
MPRAPRRFALRHRDGHSRLASLSYLTADPEHRAVAYGLTLPPPAGPERIGLVYALARLLAALESGEPWVGHGDLSTKNVLWSLQRAPEVFVIDCDNSERFHADGTPVDSSGRRRAMTPNWDDPAVARGANPAATTDRYSLGLAFLRIVGAANFPIQASQRRGEPVEVRFPVPAGPGAAALMDPSAAVWGLCARSLTLSAAEGRPPASEWLAPLEGLLAATGAAHLALAVRTAQGGGAGSVAAVGRSHGVVQAPADVRIIPVAVPARERYRAWMGAEGRYRRVVAPSAQVGAGSPPPIGYHYGGPAQRRTPAAPTWVRPTGAPAMAPHSVGPAAPILPAVWADVKLQFRRFFTWWLSLHRRVLRRRRARSRGPGRLRTLATCLIVDFAMLVLGGAAVALIVSPIIEH